MPRVFCLSLLACTAMAQPRPATAPPPGPAGTGSIEGTVSDAASHAPLKKVTVTLSGAVAAMPTAVTGGDGRFAFRGLAAGSYGVQAWKQGYNQPQQAIFSDQANAGLTLGEGEERKGVEIALAPGGAIGGRVVNEEDAPVRGCGVTAVQPGYQQARHNLRNAGVAGSASTNEKGEYRIIDLPPSRYYVFVHCRAQLPAAHPLLARDDPRTPHETYSPGFYGGGLDPATATQLAVVAGSALENVDFRLTRVPAFTVHGSISAGDAQLPAGDINVFLLPVSRLLRGLMQANASANSQTRKFQIQPVIPGSYLLYAFGMYEGHTFAAERTLEVRAAPPDAVEISLHSGADLKGSVQFDSEDHPPLENGQVSLVPVDGPFFLPQSQAPMDKDGAFTLHGIMPGRWRLTVSAAGFVKSASLGDQPVPPEAFQIAEGAGPLRIVLGSKLAAVHVEVAGATPDRPVSAVLFPEDPERLGTGIERASTAMGTGRIEFEGLAPGRYRIFALDSPNPWPILQRPDWLKALESSSVAVDVPEGGSINTTLETVPRDELMRTLTENK
jgi:Carboxypeptidase regulatory-like domain